MVRKTNYSYIGIAFVLLVFGILFIPKIVNRLSSSDVVREESRTQNIGLQSENGDPLAYILYNGEKRKVPDFSFTNQKGETISNKDYLGKVYVLEFFFTTCPSICPIMNRNLVSIQNQFPERQDFGIASITINPTFDTPEVLNAYAESYGVVNPNWHFLTGNKEAIYELANVGFNLFVAEDGEVAGGFEHSGNFALIDKEGYIRSRLDDFGNPKIYYYGLNENPDDGIGQKEEISILIQDINKLLNEQAFE